MNAGGTSTLIHQIEMAFPAICARTFDATDCSASIHKDHGWGSRVLDERSKTKAVVTTRYLIEIRDALAEHVPDTTTPMRRFGCWHTAHNT